MHSILIVGNDLLITGAATYLSGHKQIYRHCNPRMPVLGYPSPGSGTLFLDLKREEEKKRYS
jgi:hypothetical protein